MNVPARGLGKCQNLEVLRFEPPPIIIFVSFAKDSSGLSVMEAAASLWRGDGDDSGGGSGGSTQTTGGGPRAFFVGLGPRSVWAGCVIAGQFALYDLFRAMAGVSPRDLTQVLDVLGTVDSAVAGELLEVALE